MRTPARCWCASNSANPKTAPARPPIQGLGPEQERLRWWLGRGAGNPALALSWIPAGQWWLRVQYAIDRCLSQDITEQNVGTSMLDRLQGLSELPEARDKLRQLSSTGIRATPDPGPEYGTLIRQAQLVLKIDAKLGRGSDPDIVGILSAC
ncbi:hypothetical protein ACNPM8_17150 [Glutamicibacter sp. AGC46]